MICEGDEYLKMRKEEIDMNRLFDLEKALQGHPVVLRNGKKAYVRHYEKELAREALRTQAIEFVRWYA